MNDLKQVNFEDIGWNVPFFVVGKLGTFWAVRIDDSRFIRIGQSGSYHPSDGAFFYIENVQ